MGDLYEDLELRGKIGAFEDRAEAGRALARSLRPLGLDDPVVLAVPPGGVPVALAMADEMSVKPLLFFVQRLVLPSWPDRPLGSVAWGGATVLDRREVSLLDVPPAELRKARRKTLQDLRLRARQFGARRPALRDRTVVLVDEGMVSGSTVLAAVRGVHRLGAARAIVAVPTAPRKAIVRVVNDVSSLHCPNLRGNEDFNTGDAFSGEGAISDEEAFGLWSAYYRKVEY
jgi:putative phosphoribosyl transferase